MSEPASDIGAIAIVEDEPVVRRLMRLWLEADGLRVVEYGCGKDAMDLDTDGAAIVCLDLQLEDMPGQAVLARLRERDPDLPVIVVTGDQDLETAARAMLAGAYEFVTKPFDRARLEQAVRRALDRRELALKIRRLEQALGRAGRAGAPLIIGSSAAMQALAGEIERAALAPVDGEGGAAVMLIGESGTGKEIVARAIHARRRGTGPFVAVSCATIPEASQEAELFGHGGHGGHDEPGAREGGRFEEARCGTLFLDAIGEMSAAAQASLLRALTAGASGRAEDSAEGRASARIICATPRDLEAAARAGRFRGDLYALLSSRVIRLPRLRDRSDDIPLLVAHFLRAFREDVGRDVSRVEPEAMDALVRYAWPGNVRELQNVVHRAMLASDGESIQLAHLPPHIREATAQAAASAAGTASGAPASSPEPAAEAPSSEPAPSSDDASPLNLRELERAAIARALKLAGGSVGKAAKLLGIGRATLYRRLSGQREPLNGTEPDDLPEREVARS